MSFEESTATGVAIEECLDEVNDFVQTLDRFPPKMVAVAMRAHLGILLRAMLECDLCTPAEIKEFACCLEREVLEEI